MKRLIYIILPVLLFTHAAIAGTGVIINTTNKIFKEGKQVQKNNNTLYFSGNNMRIDNEHENLSMIYKGDEDLFIMIEHAKEKYYMMTESDMQHFKQKMAVYKKKMEETMKNLPPEQQQMMKEMMQKNGMNEDYEKPVFEQVASGEKIKDWSCDQYAVTRKSEKVSDYWITPYEDLTISQDDCKAFNGIKHFFSDFLSSLPSSVMSRSGYGSLAFFGSDNPAFKDGIPVKMISYENGKKANVSETRSIEKAGVEADKFNKPEEYRKVALMDKLETR